MSSFEKEKKDIKKLIVEIVHKNGYIKNEKLLNEINKTILIKKKTYFSTLISELYKEKKIYIIKNGVYSTLEYFKNNIDDIVYNLFIEEDNRRIGLYSGLYWLYENRLIEQMPTIIQILSKNETSYNLLFKYEVYKLSDYYFTYSIELLEILELIKNIREYNLEKVNIREVVENYFNVKNLKVNEIINQNFPQKRYIQESEILRKVLNEIIRS